jgi:putative colanic acid biosynthesis acetyltransferase WcaF
VGDESGIGDRAIVYNQGQITIGTRVVISQGVHLCAGTHDYTKAGFPLVTKPITIGNQVWIAAETFIHPGVTIGDGAVIGARSVVTKSMPAWKVCTGHPCQPLKDRVIENN